MRLFVVCALLFPAIAKADLSASSKVSRFTGTERLITQHVSGSKIEGTWTEAFIDFAQFAYHVRAALGGSGADGYQAYQEFNQFLDAASDKAAYEKGFVNYTHGARANRLVLAFEVTSDDDPIGILNVTAPRSFGRPRITGVNAKRGKVELTLMPDSLAVGEYPIVFYTKETDCQLCLSIAHTVVVRIHPEPVKCGPLPLMCKAPTLERDRLETAVRAAYDRKQSILATADSRGGLATHRAREHIKKRTEICFKNTGGREPAYTQCELSIPNLEGLCARNAFGVAQDDLCRDLAQVDWDIENLGGRLNEVSSTIGRLNCCNAGGSGPPPPRFD